MDWILERNRARLVQRYRANPSPWPDGIDSKSDRWYGDGSSWTEERIKRALAWPYEIPSVNPDGSVNTEGPVNSDDVNRRRRREAARLGMAKYREKVRAERLHKQANPKSKP